MARIQISAFQCERCGHIWAPRNTHDEPKVCPKCKSPYWNTPKQSERKTKLKEKTREMER